MVADLAAAVPTGDTHIETGLGGFRAQIDTGLAGLCGGWVTFQSR